MPKAIITVLLALVCSAAVNASQKPRTDPHSKAPTEPSRKRPAEIIREALPATVLIEGQTSDGSTTLGTGFIIDPSGVIVTNLHVLRGLVSATVRLSNGDGYDRVTVRAYDELKDVAILQIPGFQLPTIRLGDSDLVQQGDQVIVLGNPRGLQGSASTGIISGIRQFRGHREFQTDAAVNPGNSGGPMVNEVGEVVGVVTWGLRDHENVNFAVPINYARGMSGINDGLSLTQLAARFPDDRLPSVASAPSASRPTETPAPSVSLARLGPEVTGDSTRHALVYVYRDSGFAGRVWDPPVTLDDVELVRMDNKRFFSVWVSPGTHSLDAGGGSTNSCHSPASGELEPGMVYYLRLELVGMACFTLRPVNPDVARQAVAKLKPLNQSNVRHPAVQLR
jgi:hypothetical protein